MPPGPLLTCPHLFSSVSHPFLTSYWLISPVLSLTCLAFPFHFFSLFIFSLLVSFCNSLICTFSFTLYLIVTFMFCASPFLPSVDLSLTCPYPSSRLFPHLSLLPQLTFFSRFLPFPSTSVTFFFSLLSFLSHPFFVFSFQSVVCCCSSDLALTFFSVLLFFLFILCFIFFFIFPFLVFFIFFLSDLPYLFFVFLLVILSCVTSLSLFLFFFLISFYFPLISFFYFSSFFLDFSISFLTFPLAFSLPPLSLFLTAFSFSVLSLDFSPSRFRLCHSFDFFFSFSLSYVIFASFYSFLSLCHFPPTFRHLV